MAHVNTIGNARAVAVGITTLERIDMMHELVHKYKMPCHAKRQCKAVLCVAYSCINYKDIQFSLPFANIQ